LHNDWDIFLDETVLPVHLIARFIMVFEQETDTVNRDAEQMDVNFAEQDTSNSLK
jgi:hypothetical protein